MLILDLHLPDGNALQILPALRNLEPGMQIAVLSNDASEFSRTKCMQAGADWFFDKSTEFEKVLAVVQIQAALNSTIHT
jgi:two-component system OmpR family response regulator